mmetsp:Transcript_8871/g.15261  ORF Transcript_8871/g.15261 Transcript_8871/m.15261 type:complete len:85 (-) Transcript_8871:132-386(-)
MASLRLSMTLLGTLTPELRMRFNALIYRFTVKDSVSDDVNDDSSVTTSFVVFLNQSTKIFVCFLYSSYVELGKSGGAPLDVCIT